MKPGANHLRSPLLQLSSPDPNSPRPNGYQDETTTSDSELDSFLFPPRNARRRPQSRRNALLRTFSRPIILVPTLVVSVIILSAFGAESTGVVGKGATWGAVKQAGQGIGVDVDEWGRWAGSKVGWGEDGIVDAASEPHDENMGGFRGWKPPSPTKTDDVDPSTLGPDEEGVSVANDEHDGYTEHENEHFSGPDSDPDSDDSAEHIHDYEVGATSDGDEPSEPSPTSATYMSDGEEVEAYEDDAIYPPAPTPIFANVRPRVYEVPKVQTQDERYLAYLPHSGFHNQRIALQNAIRLSLILNRTLLVPPARLGRPAPWWPPPRLQALWDRENKESRPSCTAYERARAFADAGDKSIEVPHAGTGCINGEKWTFVDWSWILDWEEVMNEPGLRMVTRWNTSREWLFGDRSKGEGLGIKEAEVKTVEDPTRYAFQIRDSRTDKQDKGRYDSIKFVDEFEAFRDYKVLEFGSLFGTGRMRITKKENRKYATWATRGMVFGNKWLEERSEVVKQRLGGRKGYVGMHLRVGDGPFKDYAKQHMEYAYIDALQTTFSMPEATAQQLLAETKKVVGQDRKAAAKRKRDIDAEPKQRRGGRILPDGGLPSVHEDDDDGTGTVSLLASPISHIVGNVTNDLAPSSASSKLRKRGDPTSPNYDLPSIQTPSDLSYLHPTLKCQLPLRTDYPVLNTPVYVATDARNPRNDPVLAIFFKTFPCTFVLDDFVAGKEPVPRVNEIERIRSNLDGVRLKGFLLPFLEAENVAKSITVSRTPGSTFSIYVSTIMSQWYADREEKRLGRTRSNRPARLREGDIDGDGELDLAEGLKAPYGPAGRRKERSRKERSGAGQGA